MKFLRQFGSAPEEEVMAEVVRQAPAASDAEIAQLARALAESGSVLHLDDRKHADLASTGGPTSLSTLLCPLFLRALNLKVPALGVPGRPAGAIDVLASIAGYRPHLSVAEVSDALDRCGYAHFLADRQFAPADATLFDYRERVGAKNEPSLVIASLLSKKLAVGLKTVGLDIRVAPFGNFGADWPTARKNALRFQRVAAVLGLSARCFLTDGTTPYQPFIGRGESLLALDLVFRDSSNATLAQHVSTCWSIARALAGDRATAQPSGKVLRDIFDSNLESQGSSASAFDERISQLRDANQVELLSEGAGHLQVDLDKLRRILVGLQRTYSDGSEFPDPVGVVLLRDSGTTVAHGQTIARLRVSYQAPEVANLLKSAFSVSSISTTAPRHSSIEEIPP
jgi:thymidine phosphorylase